MTLNELLKKYPSLRQFLIDKGQVNVNGLVVDEERIEFTSKIDSMDLLCKVYGDSVVEAINFENDEITIILRYFRFDLMMYYDKIFGESIYE